MVEAGNQRALWEQPASLPLFREIYLACKADPALVETAVTAIERWPAQIAARVRPVPVPLPLRRLFDAAFRATGHVLERPGPRRGPGRRAQHEAVLAALAVVEISREIEWVVASGDVVRLNRDRVPAGVYLPSRLRHESGNEHRSLHHFPGFQLRSRRTRFRGSEDPVPSALRHAGPAPRADWPESYTWHFESGPACAPPPHWYVFERARSRGARALPPDYVNELISDLRAVLLDADVSALVPAIGRLAGACDEVVADHLERAGAEAPTDVARGLSALVFTRVWKLVTLRGAVHDARGTALRDLVLREVVGAAGYNPMDALLREMDARLSRLDADAAASRVLVRRRAELEEAAGWVVESFALLGVRTDAAGLLAFAHKQFGRNRNRPLYLAHQEIALPLPDPSGRKDATGAVITRGAGWMRREVIEALAPLWLGATPDDGLALLWTQIMAGYRGRVRGRRVRHFQDRLGCWPDIGEFLQLREALSSGLMDLARVVERARLEVIACRTTLTPPRLESMEAHAEDGRRSFELALSDAAGGGPGAEDVWYGDEAEGWANDVLLRRLGAALECRAGRFAPFPTVPAGAVVQLTAELLGPALTAPEGAAAARLAAIRLRLNVADAGADEAQFQLARLAALQGAGGVALRGADLVALDAVSRVYAAPDLQPRDLDDDLADALWLALLDLGAEPPTHLVEDRRCWPDLLAAAAAIGVELRRTTREARRALDDHFGNPAEDP